MDAARSEDVALVDFNVRENEFVTYYREKRIEQMAESLQREGQKDPIFVKNDLTSIWDGHTRFLAAKKLSWPTIRVIKMTVEEWQAYIQRTKL